MRFAIAASGILLAAALAAQTPQTAKPQQPTFRVGVNFVRVDIYPSINGQIVPDLKQDEFEVLEDGVRQHVETFEHVAIRTPGADVERGEPNTVQASNDAVGEPRNRVFVLFMDVYHMSRLFRRPVSMEAPPPPTIIDQTTSTRKALAGFLQRLIGPDDLIALMLPQTLLSALTFTRRPASIEEFLQSGVWQQPEDLTDPDNRDQMYAACYGTSSPITLEMIRRRHERMTLAALRGLVVHLQSLREERKAILLVSQGWLLFKPQPIGGNIPPGPPTIGIDRGKPTIGDRRDYAPMNECDGDRQTLSNIDDEREFRELLQIANRANATFYPIDPSGLEAPFANQAASPAAAPNGTWLAQLDQINRRQDGLLSLASETDGKAIINTNDITPDLKRIADDLSSYYLLGYTSTNGTADGKFRKIAVRVRRPGVTVRARQGYLAPTKADVAAAAAANPPPVDSGVVALRTALDTLDVGRPNRILLLRGTYSWRAQGTDAPLASPAVVVELDADAARGPGWAGGGQLTASLLDPDGRVLASNTASISPTARSCLIQFTNAVLPSGIYFVRVKAQWSMLTTTEQVRIVVPEISSAGSLGLPVVLRAGPYTGRVLQPTADLRFRKAERIRLEIPVAGTVGSIAGQLLDRKGQPLPVPVTVVRREEGGAALVSVDLALAPLAPGDYVIEISAKRGDKTDKVLIAIRIIP